MTHNHHPHRHFIFCGIKNITNYYPEKELCKKAVFKNENNIFQQKLISNNILPQTFLLVKFAKIGLKINQSN